MTHRNSKMLLLVDRCIIINIMVNSRLTIRNKNYRHPRISLTTILLYKYNLHWYQYNNKYYELVIYPLYPIFGLSLRNNYYNQMSFLNRARFYYFEQFIREYKNRIPIMLKYFVNLDILIDEITSFLTMNDILCKHKINHTDW